MQNGKRHLHLCLCSNLGDPTNTYIAIFSVKNESPILFSCSFSVPVDTRRTCYAASLALKSDSSPFYPANPPVLHSPLLPTVNPASHGFERQPLKVFLQFWRAPWTSHQSLHLPNGVLKVAPSNTRRPFPHQSLFTLKGNLSTHSKT